MKILRQSAAIFLFCLASYGESRPEALFQAIRNNDLTTLQAQLAKGADADARHPRQYPARCTPPRSAARKPSNCCSMQGRRQCEKFTGRNRPHLGRTDLRKAPLLIAKGADVNAHSNLGRISLMVAATCSACSELVRLFLEKGAAANLKDSRGNSAARLAAGTSAESLRLILAAAPGPTLPTPMALRP